MSRVWIAMQGEKHMKLRIKGDSLRLRVTRAELARLLNGERIEDSIHFSSAPDVHLTYALRSAEQSIPVRIECVPQAIVVLISKEQLRFWSNDSEVGITARLSWVAEVHSRF